MNANETELFIFYVQYREKLGKDFFIFNNFFQQYGVKLVPIYPSQLGELIKGNPPAVLSVTKDIQSRQIFAGFRKAFLDYALVNSRVSLYDVTSFPELIFSKKPGNQSTYKCFRLPQSFEELSNQILYEFFTSKKVSKSWPGGKRATLPQS